jgi:hypothetical protein
MSRALPQPEQTDIVGTTFEDRMLWPTTGDRFDCIHCGWNVVVGQLTLQGQGRGRDDNPLAGMPHQPQQRRSQIAERLAGASTSLDQEMVIRFQALCNRVSHLHLAGPICTADRPDGCRQHIAVVHIKAAEGLDPSGHRRTLVRSSRSHALLLSHGASGR